MRPKVGYPACHLSEMTAEFIYVLLAYKCYNYLI